MKNMIGKMMIPQIQIQTGKEEICDELKEIMRIIARNYKRTKNEELKPTLISLKETYEIFKNKK